MTVQLADKTHAEVTNLCKKGDELRAVGELESAKQSYLAALRLLPANHSEWEAATWIYVAIGDVHFQMKSFEKAFRCFSNAVQCPKGLGNPFIHLRLGQTHFEQQNLEKAADELARAYMGAGLQVFMEDDPKYLAFLETRIAI